MTSNTPLVSIGMPLYNAESRLRDALDSLLAQTYLNFELIISDNASTDNTWLICQEYAAKATRIKLYQNESNLGIVENFTRVLKLAQGEFFMWAAYDDLWEPTYIDVCLKQLLQNPDAVLCYTLEERHYVLEGSTRLVNANLNLTSPQVSTRVRRLLAPNALPHSAIYGLMRTKVRETILPIKQVQDADLLVLIELATCGKLIAVHEVLRHSYIKSKSVRERIHEVGLQQQKNIYVLVISLHVQMFYVFLRTVGNTAIRLIDKIIIIPFILLWSVRHLIWTYMQLFSSGNNATQPQN